jgi:hypothetical protein
LASIAGNRRGRFAIPPCRLGRKAVLLLLSSRCAHCGNQTKPRSMHPVYPECVKDASKILRWPTTSIVSIRYAHPLPPKKFRNMRRRLIESRWGRRFRLPILTRIISNQTPLTQHPRRNSLAPKR